MRSTSAKAYKHIMTTGVLTERQTQVYNATYQHGPLGSREAWEKIKKLYPNMDIPQHSVNPRFKEMVREGVIMEVGECVCPYTNRTVVSWDVTSKTPLKRTKGKTQPTKAQELRLFLDRFDDASGDKKVTVRRVIGRIRKAMDQIGI